MLHNTRFGKPLQVLIIATILLLLSACTEITKVIDDLKPPVTPPPVIQIDGLNVTKVEFVDSKGDTGNYHENIDGSWSEDNSTKKDHFHFTVSSKDKSSVFLYDASRDLALDLNLASKTVNYNGGTLYTITTISKAAPSRSVQKNAYAVTQIEFSDSTGKLLGNLHMNADGTWTEDSTTEKNKFSFTEEARDQWSIYLYDSSRDLSLQLNLDTKEVIYLGSYLYSISKYSETPKNGYTVTKVNFTDGEGKKLGNFNQNANGTWSEDGITEKNRFSFSEENRDLSSIYLLDSSRNVYIQLNLFTKEVLYSDSSFNAVTPLYLISNSSIKTISGYNVTNVDFTNGSGIELGSFHQNTDGTWSEDSISEKNRFLFYESGRTQSSVFIYDPTRSEIFLELNLVEKTVGIAKDQSYADVGILYTISSSSLVPKTSRVF